MFPRKLIRSAKIANKPFFRRAHQAIGTAKMIANKEAKNAKVAEFRDESKIFFGNMSSAFLPLEN